VIFTVGGAQNTGTREERVKLLLSIGISIVTRITDNDEVKTRADPWFAQAEYFTPEPLGFIPFHGRSMAAGRNDRHARIVQTV